MQFKAEIFSREDYPNFDLFLSRRANPILKDAYNKRIKMSETDFVEYLILVSVTEERETTNTQNSKCPKYVGVAFAHWLHSSDVLSTCMEAVLTPYRRKGVGSMLMEAAKSLVSTEGATALLSYLDDPMDPAHVAFMEKNGFVMDPTVWARCVERAWRWTPPSSNDVTPDHVVAPA